MTLTALIVDDERPARDELAYLLSAHADVAALEAASAREALARIESHRPDVVFQDIMMPGEDGFHVLATAATMPQPPLFVFITAFDQHAIRAFEHNAVDYLLKPVAPERLARCLDRIRQRLGQRAGAGQEQEDAPDMQRLLHMLHQRMGETGSSQSPRFADRLAPLERLAVVQGGRIALIHTREVSYIEAEERRLVAMTDAGKLVCHGPQTLCRLEERLEGLPFFRASRAVLVNLERIAEFTPWFNGKYQLVMHDQERSEITVSRNRVRDFKLRLGV
ncbi:LytR/AlgR family response regulator transcription factor [Megalodesulfovibrio gigas]|uniref:Putative two component transcriptional regulator, LytTR family n=1 Tax=Megalodesulfovibrio gigas (strain ATCC 19364 / DSM 1382 / NCIMB 9332 / VKM B-1759) TaxID=1121448 RepID=T2GA05_MEGG1|nr:response regulator [Megalodesulfovibrio gigas]AGW13009.1 putative two component transcriptional regulator, LytTR family [Megalodesulfovibrio gigas DSM 1382 = ATCC 19364]